MIRRLLDWLFPVACDTLNHAPRYSWLDAYQDTKGPTP